MNRENPQEAALRRCGPLSDPVRAVSIYLQWLVWVVAGMVAYIYYPVVLEGVRQREGLLIYFPIALGVMTLALPLAFWLLLRESGRRKVFYLRAFRSDESAQELRTMLRAAMSEKERLCGIRPPKERDAWGWRVLASVAVGFRYLGSPYFEMEAPDRNWMARLLASYAKAKFAFVDIRDVTKYVAEEIRLTFTALGKERCIFIADQKRSPEEWRSFLAEVLEVADPSELRILRYEGDERMEAADFVRRAKAMIGEVKEGAGVTDAAVDFTRGKVAPEDWATPWWERDLGRTILLWIVTFLLFTAAGLALRPFGAWVHAPVIAVGAVIVVSYFGAWFRCFAQRRAMKKHQRLAGVGVAWSGRLWGSLLLAGMGLAIIGLGVLATALRPKLEEVRAKAANMRCQVNLVSFYRWIREAEYEYDKLPDDLKTLEESPKIPTLAGFQESLRCPVSPKTRYVYRPPMVEGRRVERSEDIPHPADTLCAFCPEHDSCVFWDGQMDSMPLSKALEREQKAVER